jgi:Ala-tRNA(Pro) deacylase
MSIATRLRQLLEAHQVPFETIEHPLAFTAQEEAAASHIPGHAWAKTVAVTVDGTPALAVVPATRSLDFEKLRVLVGADRIHLATEAEFEGLYPDCDLGAMPPFGDLYGIPTFVDRELREEERVAFHAGDHATAIELSYEEYEQVSEAIPGDISGPMREPSRHGS